MDALFAGNYGQKIVLYAGSALVAAYIFRKIFLKYTAGFPTETWKSEYDFIIGKCYIVQN